MGTGSTGITQKQNICSELVVVLFFHVFRMGLMANMGSMEQVDSWIGICPIGCPNDTNSKPRACIMTKVFLFFKNTN